MYDQSVGYVQGMNFIAGAMLVHCDESIVFWLLVSLFEKYGVRDVFANNLSGVPEKVDKLSEMIVN
jgi:hypothetical protein